ncbi:hypothetical protein [uncultured Croceitalea sp.]|uniref:hypothetical protein n=1 Tax=uncultured Croceitalea sp. TaxID=1798908 RepID=UPI0033065237
MNIKFFIGLALIFSITSSCKNKSDKIKTEIGIENQETKNISELTFQEILFLLHKESEFGSDYHGELFGQEASNDISLVTKTKTHCGEEMVLVNSSTEKKVQTAIMISFNFPNNPVDQIEMVYMIKPGETLPVGRNAFCYNGKKYDIARKVLSAGYVLQK